MYQITLWIYGCIKTLAFLFFVQLYDNKIFYIAFNLNIMATNFDWVKLQNQNDYKFFACIIAEKLRNTNFKPAWREAFLKSLLEQIRPVCTFRTYERIEKLLNEVANQKHQQQQEEIQKKKQTANIKEKKLISVKIGRVKNNVYDDDDESLSDEDDEEF